jgi:sugar phosphate isomerase/epimerase
MLIPGTDNRHLTYCMNVHSSRTVAELERAVTSAKVVWDRFLEIPKTPDRQGPYGLGMWLNADVALELEETGRIETLRRELAERDCYVFTLNGFPYGVFHGERIKENVYRPDWSEIPRRDYTIRLARHLSRLLPDQTPGSISTVPITYRAWCDNARWEKAVENLLHTLETLRVIHQETGKMIWLLLEPEPDCLLDDCDSVIDFWRRLRDHSAVRRQPSLVDSLGICLDLAHVATLFEDPQEVLMRLEKENIPVVKMQISAVPELFSDNSNSPEVLLEAFRDEVYLHQTKLILAGRKPKRFADLPEAISFLRDSIHAFQLRTHFHVPLTWQPPEGLGTTTTQVSADLLQHALKMGVLHFELEVYSLGLMIDHQDVMLDILAEDLGYLARRLHDLPSGSV